MDLAPDFQSHPRHRLSPVDSANNPLARIAGPQIDRLAIDKSRSFKFEGNFYCSRSEAACVALMRRYLDFRAIDGVTIQVPLGENRYGTQRHADFRVREVFLEYHPTQQPNEPQYWRILKNTPVGSRNEFRKAWNAKAALTYVAKRRATIDENPALRGTELITATSPEEFYRKVIVRFMKLDHPTELWRIPSEAAVVREFRYMQKQVIDLNESKDHGRIKIRRAA